MMNSNNGLFGLGELLAIAGLTLVAACGLGSAGCSTYQKEVVSPAQEAQEDERFRLDTYRVSTFESDGVVSAPELDIEVKAGKAKSLSRDVVIQNPVAPNTTFSCDTTDVGSGCKRGEIISAR